MKNTRAISLAMKMALVCWVPAAWAQVVHVTADHGVVTLSVAAQETYALMVHGEAKVPVLGVVCQQKGKKASHAITFSPAGFLTEQQYSTFGKTASLLLQVTVVEKKYSTNWVAYDNLDSFAYVGKTEPERVSFLQALLGAPMISIEFTPFLTGQPVTSTFDLTGLRAEFDKHPECAIK